MEGATEYVRMIGQKTHRHGRLYINASSHARGETLIIWVLDEGYEPEGWPQPDKSVRVYDAVSGQRGWTETYGWIHKGPWVQDFEKFVESHRLANEERAAKSNATTQESEAARKARNKEILASY